MTGGWVKPFSCFLLIFISSHFSIAMVNFPGFFHHSSKIELRMWEMGCFVSYHSLLPFALFCVVFILRFSIDS